MIDTPEDQGFQAFENMVNNIIGNGGMDIVRAKMFRMPHPDFPVSKKSGSVFEKKEKD